MGDDRPGVAFLAVTGSSPLGIRLGVLALLVAALLSGLATVVGFREERGGHPSRTHGWDRERTSERSG